MCADHTCTELRAEIRDALERILDQFDLKLHKVETCRKIWMLATSDGYKYLKRSRLSAADLQFIDEALEYLHARDFKAAPRLIHSRRGEPFARESYAMSYAISGAISGAISDNIGDVKSNPKGNVKGDALYILTDWIFSAEMNFRREDDIREAAAFLAQFHAAGGGFVPAQTDYRTCWLEWPAKLAARIDQLREFRRLALADREDSPFSRLFLRHYDTYYRQAAQSYQNLIASPYRDVALVAAHGKSFCHHDYSDRNLLKTAREGIYLVDFDYCCRDLRIHDLLNFMIRLLKHRNWDVRYGRLILGEYHRRAPLAPEEIEVMTALLQWPQDFWQVGLQYYCEKLPWPPQRFLGKLEGKIQSHPARERFLREFPCQNGICQL